MFKKILVISLFWLALNALLLASSSFSYLERLETHKVTASVSFLNPALISGVALSLLGVFVVSAVLAAVTVALSSVLRSLDYERRKGTIFSFLYVCMALITANTLLVPESSWALRGSLLGLILGLFSLFTVVYFWALARHLLDRRWVTDHKSSIVLPVAVVILVSALGFNYSYLAPVNAGERAEGSPDIIIIGLDSLRPDLIHQNPELMPYTAGFLENMVVFPNAYTPLARTYPSWISMLTGQYPYEAGAFFNLVPFENVQSQPFLAVALKDVGYSTIYAANERRFSNVDERYGFDQVIGPETGLLDFVLGTISDNPIINIARRFEVSDWLLPYIRSNRAAHTGFRSKEFTEDLQSALDGVASNQPLFLSAHFCEAHWPYFKHDATGLDLSRYGHRQGKFLDYLRSLRVLDAQLEETINDLEARGRLNNSLLMVVSDHGESFSDEEIRFTQENKGEPLLVSDWGHGTKVANVRQSRVLVAMQVFVDGKRQLAPDRPEDLVSLVDVYPTVRSAAGLPDVISSGQSLFGALAPGNGGRPRIISFETGFSVPAMSERSPNMAEVFQQGFFAYQLEENGYITIKSSKIPELIDSKEVGVFDGKRLLSFGKYAGGEERAIKYDFESMTAITDITPEKARQQTVRDLATELCTRFSVYPSVANSKFCSDAPYDS